MKSGKLCIECGSQSEKWVPIPVATLERIVSKTNIKGHIAKNIIYNLQYLEYLNASLRQLYLTSVLYTLTCKIFIIVSMGIIESILFIEINNRGFQKKSIWNFLKKVNSNESIFVQDKVFRIENWIFEKLDKEHNEEMRLEQMLSIAESKELLGTDHTLYEKLNGLRKLRNKVHIYNLEKSTETDYWSFDGEKTKLAKETLLLILKEYFKLTEQEITQYFYYLIQEKQ